MENNETPISPTEHFSTGSGLDVTPLSNAVASVKAEIRKMLVGQEEMINLMTAALLSNGHVLIEGVPGIAKTMAANLLSRSLDLRFSRIQFTPDLMPADVTGTAVFNMKSGDFEFRNGPVFANVVLIDEINRAPAKTQSSLFEVMEERQVSVDGHTYRMEEPFMVLATQNPIEQEGTYKLPEAQQDRFLFKIVISYPNVSEELEILKRFQNDFRQQRINEVQPVLNAAQIHQLRALVEQIYISNDLLEYIAKVVDSTRNHPDLFLGASPRASLALMKSAKAIAAMNGRNFVVPDDVRYVTFHVLNHRIILTPDAEMEGRELKTVINEILDKVEVPR